MFKFLFTLISLLMLTKPCRGLLDQGLPQTDKPVVPTLAGSSETSLLHQLLMQESNLRMELEKQITSLQNSVYTIQKDLLQKNKEISELKANNNVMQFNLSNTGSNVGKAVVFSALLSHNLVNVPNGQVIIFDKTSVNVGNGYSTKTGIFRAPVAGVYQFTLTIGGNVVNTHANIRHNGNIIGLLYADHFHDGQYGRATLTLALHLDIGDEVWNVDPDGQINQVIIGSVDGLPVSIFTGHLIVAN
ncbi:heavy metal-binding protein HIP-like [Mytilus edulis]|uniref:heavy metal-binding protein HIP-like n=1 Tax=Mytilus edulis TaxID=6550 RepID=UPI0039EE169B